MGTTKLIKNAISICSTLAGNENVKAFLCGTYSDGSARSLPDALNGELLSPKQKCKRDKKKKGKKGKKKHVRIKL